MNNEHVEVSSDEPLTDSNCASAHEVATSDGGGGEAAIAHELVENGLDLQTHSGGTLESVEDFQFDGRHALTEGLVEGNSDEGYDGADVDEIPPNCILEYDQSEPPESVCGRDDRVQITATTRIPWRMLCQLIIHRADGRTSRCSGWFIGPRTVMTAGHCVFNRSAGGWAKRIDVIPGMSGAGTRPFGSQSSRSFRSVRGWVTNGKPEYDYGCLILPDNRLGNRVGWFGFAALPDNSLKNLLVNNAGYPGDKPFGTQWFNAGRITEVTRRRLFYMLDTFGGNSGSPTWRLRNGQRHAVGVHAYGNCPNKSTRITRSVFQNMLRWKNNP